jgi:putative oxidoreductase
VPDLAALRLTWEPRMLSILRIIVGLLYMEHGLAKVLGFPHQPNHVPYALFTLNPGLQGLLERVGGLLLALGLFTRCVAFVLAGNMAVAYFMAYAPRLLPAAQRRGVGNRLLLCLPLSLGSWRRRMEPRPTTRAGVCVRPIAEPGLSNHHG